jgi:hypothetical protein
MRSSLTVCKGVVTLVMIILCYEFGPPRIGSLFTAGVAHAFFVTSYLIFVSLCVIAVITIAYDKYF